MQEVRGECFSLDLYGFQHCKLFTVCVVRCRGARCAQFGSKPPHAVRGSIMEN